ncbi:MAG TPA: hypothetical protein DCF93_02500, partial [Desulfuromonas sp.]|nr:hypothetical protein [Desulfuromonas sp.]
MKKKLLLADDSITIQKVIAITFSSDDYLLTVVDNGDAALEKARSDRPDLILADVFMPGKNGYEVCAAVKQDPNLQGIPVLLLTGTFEPFDEGKARAAGADKWIAKPFESQSLIDCIEKLLAGAGGSAPKAVVPIPSAALAETPPQPVPAPPSAVAPIPASIPAPAPPTAPVVPAPPPVTAETDPWGDPGAIDLDLSELGGEFGDVGTAPLSAADSDEDLWGAVSLEEQDPSITAISSAGADSWSLDEAIEMSAPAAELADAVRVSTAEQDVWGGLEVEPAGADASQIELEEFPTWEAEVEPLPMSDVEILEEEDIEPSQALTLQEPFFTPPAGGILELEATDAFGGDPMSGELQWDESALTAVSSTHGERAPVAAPVA